MKKEEREDFCQLISFLSRYHIFTALRGSNIQDNRLLLFLMDYAILLEPISYKNKFPDLTKQKRNSQLSKITLQ